jgi:hypothetical protein
MFGWVYRRTAEGHANVASVEEALGGEGEVLIAVHGTFAAEPGNDGANWWQRGSPFMTRLAGALEPKLGRPPRVLPFHWSGENSEFDRLAAGRRLEAVMRRLERAKRPYHVLAHSHGGNVVVAALRRFARIGRKYPHLRSVTTFGTPYFRRTLKPLSKAFLTYRLALLAFMFLLALVVAVGLPLLALVAATQVDSVTSAAEAVGVAVGFAAMGALLLIPAWLLWRSIAPMAREKARLLKSVHKCGLCDRWLALWARRDEAIGLLTRATAFNPRFIAPKAMARSLGRLSSFIAGGVVAGATIASVLFGWRISALMDSAAATAEKGAKAANVSGDVLTDLVVIFLYAMPVFAIVHLGLSTVFRMGPHRAAAWFMNNTITGGLRTGVFGDDAHFKLQSVGATPERMEVKTKEFESLKGVTDEDAVEAAHALYTELIELNPDGQAEADPAGVWERLSQSIYHNSYFVDDAVMAAAAEHIADNAANVSDGTGTSAAAEASPVAEPAPAVVGESRPAAELADA